jgi:hypothetical protein
MNAKPQAPSKDNSETPEVLPFCGIIMPIAAMAGYDISHWDRVRTVLNEAIQDAGFSPRLVSESEDIGVIHARIVQNLYEDTIVVCDVSGKNANVMFELGMRLAFDKPTIVIKDNVTDYSFDTSPIEHINYRADLRYDDVRDFKKRLTTAIEASTAKRETDPTYSPFLAHFGKFKVTGLDTTTVGTDQFIIEQLSALQVEVSQLSRRLSSSVGPSKAREMALNAALLGTNSSSPATRTVAEALLNSYASGHVVQTEPPLSSRGPNGSLF